MPVNGKNVLAAANSFTLFWLIICALIFMAIISAEARAFNVNLERIAKAIENNNYLRQNRAVA